MNPSELRMMWMSQYNPNERISLEDAATFFNPNIGLSVMDDIGQQQQQHQQQQQQQTMDVNSMMNLVGGDFNNQAAVAAAAAAASSAAALGIQPTTLLATNTNDIYNFAQMGLHQQLLQQSAAAVFQNYTNVEDMASVSGAVTANFNNALNVASAATGGGGILVNSNGRPITTAQFLANAGQQQQQQSQSQQQQQVQAQMYDDTAGGYGDDSAELTPKKEIINIDDFVMMTDSNSYDEDGDFINDNDKSTSGGIDITQPHGVNDNDLLTTMSLSGKHKLLSDAAAAAAANRIGDGGAGTATATGGVGASTPGVGGGGTTSSLRSQRKTRKIEPVNRPGLVLKTPIAYKGNIDPSVIPIQKDGMAVCERCGAIGVKHTFYTKSRRFCSMACARGELYSLVVNKQGYTTQQQQQALFNMENNFNENKMQQQQQQQQSAADAATAEAASHQQQQQTMFAAAQQQANDVEMALRVAHIKNTNYRFRITDQSKITQINGLGEPINNNNNNVTANNAVVAPQPTELVDTKAASSVVCGGGQTTSQLPINTAAVPGGGGGGIQYATDSDQLAEMTGTPKALRMYRDVMPQDELPQIPKYDRLPTPCPQMEKIISIRRKLYDPTHSYDWTPRLGREDFYAAPVTCFHHAPGCDVWDNLGIDMKVEVENTDCDQVEVIQPGQTPHSFWVATILDIQGYKALMRYEGFEDEAHDFWVNLCNSEVHAVGWCATRGKPLIPPRSIENKYKDWKDFLVTRLSGARTLPSSFYNKVNDSMQSRFRLGLNLECVDKDRISQVRLATVTKIVGKRLFLRYFDSDDGFWCHEDSPIIHPVGWATTVGHNLAAPQDYLERMLAGRDAMIEVHEDDATIELFKMNFTFEEYYLENKAKTFVEGMKLEAVDPLNLSSICVATVMAVLKFGYMMIRIDSYQPDATGADWFCYHEKSPNIFPVGFCITNNITLTPPYGYTAANFTWEQYLRDTNSVPAGSHLFHRTVPSHGFEVGMSLECADLMDPRLVCVATVSRVVGRLLKIHFDGWTDEYDQWLDCESSDIYPVGWCILVGHKLEGPPAPAPAPPKTARKPRVQKKRKKRPAAGGKNSNTSPESAAPQVKSRTIALKTTPHLPKLSIKLELKPEHHNPAFYDNTAHDAADDDEDDDIDEYDEDTNSMLSNQSSTHMMDTSHGGGSSGAGTTSLLMNPAAAAAAAANSSGIDSKNSSVSNTKYIPRLSDCSDSENNAELMPDTWNVYDVSQFLRVNDCTAHCDTFSRNKIDGKRLLQLSKDEIITLLGMKVGPALKIYDLIQQLKCKVNPGKSRMHKNNKYL
ncbi:scm-related gene containing four mbt domains isoform X2 [Musca autumnalis]|uniref:scm-related gene containing four mbt domains isoform X2 n=1 Tax=Musca autumnalis TaxID=221902 RepID=UPI003CF21DFD